MYLKQIASSFDGSVAGAIAAAGFRVYGLCDASCQL